MKAKPAKWTAEMDNRLRDLYPKLLNSDIAKHFNLTKHQIEYRAEYIGLKKPPGFKQQHMQESCAKRNLNTARARASSSLSVMMLLRIIPLKMCRTGADAAGTYLQRHWCCPVKRMSVPQRIWPSPSRISAASISRRSPGMICSRMWI